MAKTWRRYEIMVLIDAGLAMEAAEQLIEKCREIIRNAGGRMVKTERWGLRDLAFPIKRHAKAYYVLLEYVGEGAVSTTLSHHLNLLDTVVKFQGVKLAEGIDPAELPEADEIIVEKRPVAPPPEVALAVGGDEEEGEEAFEEEDAE